MRRRRDQTQSQRPHAREDDTTYGDSRRKGTCACASCGECRAALHVTPRRACRVSFHFISFHFISFHFISFHFISFHFISFHFISFHFISFHFISFHFISFHFISFSVKCAQRSVAEHRHVDTTQPHVTWLRFSKPFWLQVPLAASVCDAPPSFRLFFLKEDSTHELKEVTWTIFSASPWWTRFPTWPVVTGSSSSLSCVFRGQISGSSSLTHCCNLFRRLLALHQAERHGRVSNCSLRWQEFRHVYLDTERHEIWHSASGKHTRHYSCLAYSGDIVFLFLGTTTGDVAVVLIKNRVVQHFLFRLQGMREEHGFDSFSDSSLARGRCSSLSAEKQVRIVLAIAARVGPNTQDRADDVVATTGSSKT